MPCPGQPGKAGNSPSVGLDTIRSTQGYLKQLPSKLTKALNFGDKNITRFVNVQYCKVYNCKQ